MFKNCHSYKAIGEATPCYSYHYSCPMLIWQYNPDMKIIIILRNPIERAFSHWNMQRHNIPSEKRSFWDSIQKIYIGMQKTPRLQSVYTSYIDRGFYSEQIRRLWRFFPKENVYIIKNEDLRFNPQDTLNGIADFLNVSHFKNVKKETTFHLEYDRDMSEKERDYLRYTFEYEIKQLERMLDWDCSNWLS
jgi:hypothetical protein